MNLLILEYISGGGYSNQKLSSSTLSEAYGMLRNLISDCKAAGHNVTTLMNSRLNAFNPPNEADNIVPISSSNEIYDQLSKLSNLVDAVYVIAPESDQILEKLLRTIAVSGGNSLNCEVDAIKQVSNKMKSYKTLKNLGLKVPETSLLDIEEKTKNIKHFIKELGYPLVFKPLDGVSCSGLSVVKDENGITRAVKKIAQESVNKQFIVQKLIRGKAASVSVISTGVKALAVTLNKQLITLASPDKESGYYGGAVPFHHNLEMEALRTAERAVEAVSGLKGYVGVDLVLTENEPVIMEVNPRLTTSYIGLKRAVNFNTAEAIVDATISRKLPKNVQYKECSFFSKVKVQSCPQIITQTYKMKDVLSPPFPIEGNKSVYALIAASSSSSRGALSAFNSAKERLQKLCGGD